jgi:RNA polymerase sigma-70 factor, ECF subfamily
VKGGRLDSSERNEEFVRFVSARGTELGRLALLLAGGDQAAEDLLQEGFVAALKAWDRLGGPDHAEAYIRRAMINMNISWWRRRRRHPERLVADVPEGRARTTVQSDGDGVADELDLMPLIRGLPQSQRAVLVLRFYLDLSVSETAALLGVSPGTVKSHTARGLTKCRAALDRAEKSRSSHE